MFYSSLMKAYYNCLLDPEFKMARIPDGWGQKTVLIRSVESYEIPAIYNNPNTTDDGKFGWMCQPILGNPANVEEYATYIVMPDPGASPQALYWGTDWSAPGSYQGDNGTRDPRMIAITPTVTNQRPSLATYASNAAITNLQPFGFPGAFTTQTYNNSAIMDPSNGVGSVLVLPAGNWLVSWTVPATAGGAALTIDASSTANVLNSLSNYYGVAANGAAVGFALISVPGTTSPGNTFVVRGPVGFTGTNAVVLISPMYSDVVSPTGKQCSFKAGSISRIRPVAMSALCTCLTSNLDNGGNIVAALVPAQTAANDWFSNSNSATGQLQEVNGLNQVDRCHDDRFATGSYSIWVPESDDDTQFYDVDKMNEHDYPVLAGCGFYKPNNSPGANVNVARLRVVRVFEIQTATTLWEMRADMGDDAAVKAVLQLFTQFPTSTANAIHWKHIVSAMKKAGTLIGDAAEWGFQNKDWILKGAAALGTVISAL